MLTRTAPRAHEAGSPRTVSRRVLVVSGTEKGRDALKRMMEGSVFRPAAFAGNGGEARRMMLASGFDAVIINAPLPDEFGHELARHAAEGTAGVMLAVKSEALEEVSAQVEGCGVLTLGKPLTRMVFSQALSLLAASQDRLRKAEEENRKLRGKLEELRVVSRAKCLLVEHRRLTEEEAHKLIEKEAMDRRATRRAVAEEIIKSYE